MSLPVYLQEGLDKVLIIVVYHMQMDVLHHDENIDRRR